MDNLKIDPEFKNLIPPLTDEEYQQLTDNLLKDGCRDALIVWNGTIIDGHNRYEICKYHKIEFRTEEKQFNSRDEVKEWIIRNQFGRRNLSTYDRTRLAFQLEELIKAKAKDSYEKNVGRPDKNKSLEPVPTIKVHTDEELAKIAGVSPKTIQYARKVEKQATSEQKERLRKGEAKIKTIYKEIIKKEDKPVKQPDKQKNIIQKELDETGFPKVVPIRPPQKDIFSISLFEEIATSFIIAINPLAYGAEIFKEMSESDKQIYLDKFNEIRHWLDAAETEIKKTI